MGGVAQIAGEYLIRQLGATSAGEVAANRYFDLAAIRVAGGLVVGGELPRSVFYRAQNSHGRHLILFLGEQQPPLHGYRFCVELLEKAREMGARRVITFAAMGTPMRAKAKPRVFAVSTEPTFLNVIREHGAAVLEEGKIRGLNGVLLAAAAAAGLPGACLLGEFPYLASAMPNPRASSAILRIFAELSGIALDLDALDQQATRVEPALEDHVLQLEEAASLAAGLLRKRHEQPREEPRERAPEPEQETLDSEARVKLEALFAAASQDRSKALELKAELDRHGLFERYEDRFLDLFKDAG